MISSVKSKHISNSSALVNTLQELGVDSVFGYPGAAVLSVYNELADNNFIEHYLVRHEQAAVHAAEGYARVSGKTGVVLVTSGPGFTNTVTGIANAFADSTPLVILVGDVSENYNDEKIFQNIDIESIVKPCCKEVFKLKKGDDIVKIINTAFLTANSEVKGPVVVILPRNILEADFNNSSFVNNFNQDKVEIIESDIDKIFNEIKMANKPLFLLGGGCIDYAVEIETLISKFQIPVISTLMGIGVYPSENNLYLGMIGLNGTEIANKALNECDLLISLGVAFSDRSTCKKKNFFENLKIINVNIESSNRNIYMELISDVGSVVRKLSEYEINKSYNRWLLELDLYKSEFILPESLSQKLSSSIVLKTISEYTKYYEPIVVTDVGQHQMLTAQFFNFNKPRKFITSGGLGTMGFGLPAAMGANIAKSENLILNITGDGSFQMNLQELATCREHNIPIKVIIMNNGYLGMVRQLQEKIYSRCYQVEMTNPDFVKIAEAYDLMAIRIKSIEELIPALEKAINHNGTVILDVIIDSFENI